MPGVYEFVEQSDVSGCQAAVQGKLSGVDVEHGAGALPADSRLGGRIEGRLEDQERIGKGDSLRLGAVDPRQCRVGGHDPGSGAPVAGLRMGTGREEALVADDDTVAAAVEFAGQVRQ